MFTRSGTERITSRSKVVLVSIIAAALFWVIDSAGDALIFHDGDFISQLFSPAQSEIWTRLITCCILTLAVYSAFNIAGRKQLEEKLRASEEKYRSVVENIGIGISVISPDMEILALNHQMKEWFPQIDVSKSPVCYQTFNTPPGETVCSYCPTCKTLTDGETHEAITDTPAGDSFRHYLVRSSPIKNDEGKVIAAIEMVEDITDRRGNEDALQKSTQTLQSLIHASPLAIIVLDTDGLVKMWSPASELIFGWKEEEVLGKPNPIVPEDKQEEYSSYRKRMLNGESFTDLEMSRRKKDGTPVEVSLSTAPLYDAEGKINGIMAVIADITERKRMEAQIFQIKHDWEDTFDTITDMITIHDKDFNIIHANKAAEKILGLPVLKNIASEKCYKYYHGSGHPPEGCPSCACYNTGVPATFELYEPHLRKFIEIRAIPRFDSNNNLSGLIHVARDITERRKLEDQLRQAQKMEAIGQLAGGIAHDFNNILTAIIGYSNILKIKMDKDDPLKNNIEQILTASERGANLTQSLLAFSRQQATNLEPVRVNEIIKSMESLLLRVIGEDIELKTVLRGNPAVMADRVQIDQVLINLCTNARDAMPGGGSLAIETGFVELDKEFISAYGYGKPGAYAFISVSDTGIGIDENIRGRIFEPFFTTKEVGKGTGLGLSIVYGITKQHNGYVDCSSEHGAGTTFTIYLPIVEAEIEDTGSETIPEYSGAGATILLAEDEPVVRKLTSQVLEEFGYNVIEAVDGEDAVIKFAENKDEIALLLFDVIMPKMNGKEAYDRIKEMKPDINALLISGYPADFINKQEIIKEGIAFVAKPISPSGLLSKVKVAMGK